MCLMLVTPMEFSRAENSALFQQNIRICSISSVAVVDMRRVLRVRETTARGV
jgi:hypothetical protein